MMLMQILSADNGCWPSERWARRVRLGWGGGFRWLLLAVVVNPMIRDGSVGEIGESDGGGSILLDEG